MTTSGPEGPTRPNRARRDERTGRLTGGPDAPTHPTAGAEPATRRIARAVRGVLTDTRPLRTPAYRRLWTAGIVTVIGAQLSVVAVPAQIYELTGSSAYVGLTGLFGLVPLVVFGLWGGAIADAVDRRTLLLFSGGGIALSSLALWVTAASGAGGVWLVLVLFAVQTAFLAINQPARNAVIPRLLPADQLPAANALNMTVFQVGAIAGPLLAGVLIPVIGLPTLYLLDAIALLATLWATWRLPAVPPAGTGARRRAGLREIVDGFRYAALHAVLLVSFLIDIVAMAFGMPRAVFPEISQTVYGDPPGGGFAMGLLFAAIPLGMVAAGLFTGLLHRVRRQGVAVTLAICTWGVGVALFGLTSSLWLAVLFLAIAGAGDVISSVYRMSILQSVATDEMRGRMQGVFGVVVAGGPRVADLWHGPAAEWWGPGVAASVGGVAVVVGAVVVVAAFPIFWRYRAAH
ncbi:MFS transporter [Pseudonocardia kunmingensis]|uniref:Putative MFS family arabinose efflux permease n=1 Tax=Pseudonocardia kunmingensis TaxID=630975 RepID=A0A543DA31_9PSEU|nr:MFS transporter [Pseudonocardia kunmingensis]TQM06199.1 putative MFS family arabinose efflux permease [Pseudonocardia kunmingensis]